jgi:hypothetical protein
VTVSGFVSTRETVAIDTPACLATSKMFATTPILSGLVTRLIAPRDERRKKRLLPPAPRYASPGPHSSRRQLRSYAVRRRAICA